MTTRACAGGCREPPCQWLASRSRQAARCLTTPAAQHTQHSTARRPLPSAPARRPYVRVRHTRQALERLSTPDGHALPVRGGEVGAAGGPLHRALAPEGPLVHVLRLLPAEDISDTGGEGLRAGPWCCPALAAAPVPVLPCSCLACPTTRPWLSCRQALRRHAQRAQRAPGHVVPVHLSFVAVPDDVLVAPPPVRQPLLQRGAAPVPGFLSACFPWAPIKATLAPCRRRIHSTLARLARS